MTDHYDQLKARITSTTPLASATAFAPSNIALCKYWGKRDVSLNLPLTDSLSISLGHLGATTTVSINTHQDIYTLNGLQQPTNSSFYRRLHVFLNHFRTKQTPYFSVKSELNIPYAAGLASSACGFAAITEALNKLLQLELDKKSLSQISRLGSGSAARSHWQGLVHWHSGQANDGSDCFATAMPNILPHMRIGIILTEQSSKLVSSRQAMQQCFTSESTKQAWQSLTNTTLQRLQKAIDEMDWPTVGQCTQSHAQAMHQLIQEHCGAIFDNSESIAIKKKIESLQQDGERVFWTQDAGPQIKLLFKQENEQSLLKIFPDILIINPWEHNHA